jgi:hypothetical protein
MRRGLVAAGLAVLLGACIPNPSPPAPSSTAAGTAALPAKTGAPSMSPKASLLLPSPLTSLACGPLDADLCQSAVLAVERTWQPELGTIVGVAFRGLSASIACPTPSSQTPSASACGVLAEVTTSHGGQPVDFGLALTSTGWGRSGALDGWWGNVGDTSCAIPAWYRIQGRVDSLGACVGLLGDPTEPASVTIAVGQSLDLHMGVGGPQRKPFYSLPWSSDSGIVDQTSIVDAATATYTAFRPGTAVLTTTGFWCMEPTPTGPEEGMGACPLVRVVVGP